MKLSIDGSLVDPDGAAVSALDRGLLYGDGVFEVMRTYDGVPFAERRHLERLETSARRVALRMPVALEQLSSEIRGTVEAAGGGGQHVRVLLTRGHGGRPGFDPTMAGDARRIIACRPLGEPDESLYREGVSVALVQASGAIAGTKSASYQPNVMATHEARQRGAYEAILHDREGALVEGASSNVFVVHNDVLYTPPAETGLLEGITRAVVMGLARIERIPLHATMLFPYDLYTADEAFLTSSIRELVPVIRADGQAIGDGRPGPVARRLHAAYRRLAGVARP